MPASPQEQALIAQPSAQKTAIMRSLESDLQMMYAGLVSTNEPHALYRLQGQITATQNVLRRLQHGLSAPNR